MRDPVLIGADDVRAAGRQMVAAAQQMSAAASQIEAALSLRRQWEEEYLARLEALAPPLARPVGS